MTAAALAAFADSDQGRLYAQVCQHWHVDPAADIEDEVLAHSFRMGLGLRLVETEDEPDEGARHREMVERAREAAARVKGMTG